MLQVTEKSRIRVSQATDAKHKSQLGQFLTPESTARFMAAMFPISNLKECRLLDAGAGIGSLSSAFLERQINGGFEFENIALTSYEIDDLLYSELFDTLSMYKKNLTLSAEIKAEDFIESAVNRIQFGAKTGFTHAILNPPYKKISSSSRYRLLLKSAGIETVNLYSAFVALTILLMEEGGNIVAILPRSFCNGPYYKPFRELIFSRCAIKRIHLFDSRKSAFKGDGVLQENVIIHLEVGRNQKNVDISVSTDDRFFDLACHSHAFESIVYPDDKEKFIHIPSTEKKPGEVPICGATKSLAELGLMISTGPVVDFRLKEYLLTEPTSESVPLFYPVHFSGLNIEWPLENIKKPNAIIRNTQTEKWLYPNGYYCIVRRFSSKEEKRRIVACVVDPQKLPKVDVIGFENHLNVFHENHHGMPMLLAKGLALFLNSTMVDDRFRQFSGHTQVNATDLKLIRYPSREDLIALGKAAEETGFEQGKIDKAVLRVCEK